MGLLVTLLGSLLQQGCGKFASTVSHEENTTRVSFSPNDRAGGIGAETIFPLYGNIGIYIRGTSGTDFSTVLPLDVQQDPGDITLPNGTYMIFAVGWEGNDTPGCTPGTDCFTAEGITKCAVANGGIPVTLAGGDVNIPLNFTTANCAFGSASVFSEAAYSNASSNFPKIKISFGAGNPYNTGSFNLSFDADIYTEKGGVKTKIGSKRIGCGAVTGGIITTPKRLPTGSAGGPGIFAMTVKVYASADTNCISTPLSEYNFANGFIRGLPGGTPTTSISYISLTNTITIN